MSFDDHQAARPTAQQTERCTPEQIRDARATCERWVRSRAGGDPELLHEFYEMLDLEPRARVTGGGDPDTLCVCGHMERAHEGGTLCTECDCDEVRVAREAS